MLGDGDDADALLAEHGLEGDGVFALAGEAAEFPYEDDLEGRVGLAALVDHPAELWPVCDASALGLVDVLADDGVVVLLRVVPERAELGRDGEVDVLSVAGNAGVEGCGGGVLSFVHGWTPSKYPVPAVSWVGHGQPSFTRNGPSHPALRSIGEWQNFGSGASTEGLAAVGTATTAGAIRECHSPKDQRVLD